MANAIKSLFILPLFFVSGFSHIWSQPKAFELFNQKHILGPHELFGNPFGNPEDYKKVKVPDDFGTPINNGEDVAVPVPTKRQRGSADTPNWAALGYKGAWELVSQNSGVSAMHAILLPKIDKVLMYDATIWKISKLPSPNGHCRVLNKTTGEKDCWSHSVLFDINNSELTPLELHTDTWCSSGGLDIDGNLVSTGGYQGGANTVRYLGTCKGCNWREYPTALADRRWYSTQATLPDGGFIVVGGRDAFSYEYIPAEGKSNAKPFFFDFLRQTSDPEENNLYPFVFLSTDGNVFIFANSRSVLLNPKSNKIVRELPVLPGGHRSYPASGMSALLPIKLHADNQKVVPAEVLICGGSAHKDSYSKAEKQIFYTALQDCARIKITDKNPVWKRELMPTPRIMGDMMILPSGEVLILNGAERGASGWGFAREPNFTPVLYNPRAKRGERFTELAPSTIARMYHSVSAVLPDGKVLVGGSNTNNGYIYDAMYPTELRIEKFSPPYLNAALAGKRPVIVRVSGRLTYGGNVGVQIKLNGFQVLQKDLKVTIYAPAFTTHGVSMNQRHIDLGLKRVQSNDKTGIHDIMAVTPPSSTIAPPGYYMLSVVFQGVPSVAQWVQIK
ncbi:hypothetical protein P3X46_019436 [Hevea brasiliensis]|uniref:Galactose oxidase-like Early set domain-containing protein n=1 Tax=Hevea brasiliensis TaxID=3981 RepID=A0ABQ9LLL9_HEVBR|nr:aldehyde oxidase GLOX1-like [Hevea brasiliensis]KAJ9167845.1 hypothetical protein P3X46_019436 [Hevea brasiliensis]